MHIGAATHAELFRCSKTIGSVVEHQRLNHGMIITPTPLAVGGSWAVRLFEILVSAMIPGARLCQRRRPAPGFASADVLAALTVGTILLRQASSSSSRCEQSVSALSEIAVATSLFVDGSRAELEFNGLGQGNLN